MNAATSSDDIGDKTPHVNFSLDGKSALVTGGAGLIFSQALRLYTTGVVYLYFDRLREWWASRHRQTFAPLRAASGRPDAI
jgi:hypothetical protein